MHKVNHLVKAFVTLLRRRGIVYLGYLLTGYLIPRLGYETLRRISPSRLWHAARWILFVAGILAFILFGVWMEWFWAVVIAGGTGGLAVAGRWGIQNWKLLRMQRQAMRLHQEERTVSFTSWGDWPVDDNIRQKVGAYRKSCPDREIVLGNIDNDGRVLGLFGDLPGVQNVSKDEFVARYRFPLDIVLLDSKILVRKDFRGDRERFAREWYNLESLRGQANVPAVYRVEGAKTVLYKNMISGRTIRDVLVDAGAEILNVQTDHDPALASISQAERLRAVLARGTELLSECFPESFFQCIESQMDIIHRCGIAGLSLTFGNIMVDDDGQPWFVDLEGAHYYRSTTHPLFLWQRDQDRSKFNRIYAREVMTESKAREELARLSASDLGWYAPIDFGAGLAVNGFWSVDSGTGRWEFLNHRVMAPLIAGKRILDLGSNNGIMPLLMLKDGAREVVGLELMPEMVERARVIHEIYEWRDMKRYPFTIHTCDMRAILDANWGEFDLISAFCSLYYLNEDDMGRVVRRAAELASVMVIQAKVDTRLDTEENKTEKSSIPFLQGLLQDNGYSHMEIYAPPGYSRPLLVGYRDFDPAQIFDHGIDHPLSQRNLA